MGKRKCLTSAFHGAYSLGRRIVIPGHPFCGLGQWVVVVMSHHPQAIVAHPSTRGKARPKKSGGGLGQKSRFFFMISDSSPDDEQEGGGHCLSIRVVHTVSYLAYLVRLSENSLKPSTPKAQ
jgi:hypothetical protein